MRLAIPLLAAALLATACPGDDDEATTAAPALVLATLDGDPVVHFDDFAALARARTAAGEFPRTGSGFELVRDRLVRDLVVQEILLAEAASRGLNVEDEELERAELIAAEGVLSEDRLPEVLAERYGSVDAWEELVRRRLLAERVESVLREELGAAAELRDEDLAAGRERFADAFVRPARLRARQVFAEDASRIRAAQADLADGVAFVELAQRVNQADGDMGWMATAEAPPELVESLEGLEVGEFTEVVRSPLGYHLFQLLGREPASELSDEEQAALVEGRLRDEAAEAGYREWLAGRLEARRMELNEDALARVRCCRRGLPYAAVPDEES